MSHARKRQRLSPSGDAAITAVTADTAPVGEAEDLDREPASTPKKQAAPNSLFVRQLPTDATTETLTEHFSQSYLIKHATVVLDPATKKSKGYGFVTFADPEDTAKACKEFNGSRFGTKRLRVEIAQKRHRVVDDSGVAGACKSRPAQDAATAKRERQKKRAEERPSTKLIIRNLPWSIEKPDQLSALFKRYGKVKKTILPTTKPGRSPGFGFVVLDSRENAEKVIKEMNGKQVDGRALAIDWAVDKEAWERHKQGLEDVYAGNGVASASDAEDEASAASDNGGGGVELESGESNDEPESTASSAADLASEIDSSGEHSDEDEAEQASLDESGTLFVRNLPFSATNEVLFDHFSQFGALRYARVVMDHETERSRGTAFVCFYKKQDAISCLRAAPAKESTANPGKENKATLKHSLLENTMADPSGEFTLEGRILHVSRAVNRDEANRLTAEGQKYRDKRDTDKRRLYLLSEGTISANSPLYHSLPPSERKLRDDSAKQRQTLVRGNPSLHLSLTRLSVRNIPRHVTSKQLKALAREAVVGFAKELKAGSRQPLSKEELARDGEAMKAAERERKAKGKGIVRQAKVVFENKTGSKVTEDSGAGRSRGYGFIEYNTHRLALMGLRYLNGHLVQRSTDSAADQQQANADKPKRLVVEFAIENVQVVSRRHEREQRSRNKEPDSEPKQPPHRSPNGATHGKRKRGNEAGVSQPPKPGSGPHDSKAVRKQVLRNSIIGRKRMKRKSRQET